MSHFTVAVFSHSPEDVDRLLAPFDEQSEEYYEIEPASEPPHELSEEYHRRKDEFADFEDFLSSVYGYVLEDGVIGYRCNPNAKWDWYQIGGRWMGSLKLKEGCTGNDGDASWATHPSRIGAEGRCDQALLKDVDFSLFGTWAILTPDGEWHEKGDMGWWGMNSATAESRKEYRNIFDAAVAEFSKDPDIWITIVDCHI